MRTAELLRPLCCLALLFVSPLLSSQALQAQASLSVLDRSGSPTIQFTDGDLISLRVQAPAPSPIPSRVRFYLDADNVPLSECTIQTGKDNCQSETFLSLGWYWSKDRQPRAERQLRARLSDLPVEVAISVHVVPRPVVMVHGFSASADAWRNYLGRQGFLAAIGLRGFAVGDGQVEGRLNTGDLANPTRRTNTIAENAAIVGQYIANVKRLTGAQQVDLIAHSMGGLIARYYIDRVMQERDIAQLVMLGSPNRGTDCSILPASLGFFLPATLEIRPEYVLRNFNRQITHRKGIPFHLIAGTPIIEPIKSPCTGVPSDLIIARQSVGGVSGTLSEIPILHTDLNESAQVFEAVVKPILQKTAGQFPVEADPAPVAENEETLQFTRVFTGHVGAGESRDFTINIDRASVASFALFDPTRSLTVTVRGASGNLIQLDPVVNGLIVVDDPATLVYLGYGFNNPLPGPWRITLNATDKTPLNGTDFALTARLSGGAVLKVQMSSLIPQPGEPVRIMARVELAGQALSIRQAQALIRGPDGKVETIALTGNGADRTEVWTPQAPGLYGIDVTALATSPDGMPIDRTAFLSADVQPPASSLQPLVNLALIVLLLLALVLTMAVLVRRVARK